MEDMCIDVGGIFDFERLGWYIFFFCLIVILEIVIIIFIENVGKFSYVFMYWYRDF